VGEAVGKVRRKSAADVTDHQDKSDSRCARDQEEGDDDEFQNTERMLHSTHTKLLPHRFCGGTGGNGKELHDCGEQIERGNENGAGPADDGGEAGFHERGEGKDGGSVAEGGAGGKEGLTREPF